MRRTRHMYTHVAPEAPAPDNATSRGTRTPMFLVLLSTLILILAACSSEGGGDAEDASADAASGQSDDGGDENGGGDDDDDGDDAGGEGGGEVATTAEDGWTELHDMTIPDPGKGDLTIDGVSYDVDLEC